MYFITSFILSYNKETGDITLSSGSFILSLIGLIIVILYIILRYIDPLEKILGAIYTFFARSYQYFEKPAVAKTIQSRLNMFSSSSLGNAWGLEGKKVKVKWISKGSIVSTLMENKTVIALDYSKNHAKNISLVSMQYVRKGILPNERHILNPALNEAIDLVAANDIICEYNSAKEISYFRDTVVNPRIESIAGLKHFLEPVRNVRDRGYFKNVFMPEVVDIASLTREELATGKIMANIDLLLDFLNKMAKRERGEDITLSLSLEYVKIGFILIARTDKIVKYGVQPYLDVIQDYHNREFKSVYLLAGGYKIKYLRLIENKIASIDYIAEDKYKEYISKVSTKRAVNCAMLYIKFKA